MRIKQCAIKNFTVFDDQTIEFCSGVNVIIGANSTGKSHLLKILYAIIQWITGENHEPDRQDRIIYLLNGLFKLETEFSQLFRDKAKESFCKMRIDNDFSVQLIVVPKPKLIFQTTFKPTGMVPFTDLKGVFIPPNEVLSIYPGFTASYEKRELAFDQSYYDICKALSAAPLKQQDAILSQLKCNLEEILHGKVIQRGDHFYVQNKTTDRTLEAHLLAEGHKKIATLVHLINNGSIDKDTILFWDEPEASMNPRLIKHIAKLLRELANAGIQVFIATHDYLLTGELSLAAEYNTEPHVPIRFFAMSREVDEPVEIQHGDTLADLQDNPILDEFAAHYERERLLFYDQSGDDQ